MSGARYSIGPGLDAKRRNYQEITLVIMYHRATSPAATKTNIPMFSQKCPSLKALFLLMSLGGPLF